MCFVSCAIGSYGLTSTNFWGEQLETFSSLMNKKTPDLPLRWLILIVRASVHMFIYVHCQHISTHPCKTCVTLGPRHDKNGDHSRQTHDIPSLYFHQQNQAGKPVDSWCLLSATCPEGWTVGPLNPFNTSRGLENPWVWTTGTSPKGISTNNHGFNQSWWLTSSPKKNHGHGPYSKQIQYATNHSNRSS